MRAALDELLAWEPLRRSPQLSAFLAHIVEAALRGDTASLKAYSIAVDVFGRGEDFDPQTDPIVRVQARRLRQLLKAFYASEAPRASVQIELPVGRYVPEFRLRDAVDEIPIDSDEAADIGDPGEPPRRDGARNGWLLGMVAIGVLGAAIVF